MDKRKWIGSGLILVALGAGYIWIQSGEGTAVAPGKLSLRSESKKADVIDASLNRIQALLGMETKQDPVGVGSEVAAPDNLYQEVFERNPELLQSLRLQKVIVKDSNHAAKKWELYTNKEYLDNSFKGLHQLHKDSFDLDVQLERMYKVDFIKVAASMKDHPQREYVRDQIVKLTTALPEGYHTVSEENKRSMMGDRIELYYIMLKYYPEFANEFNAQVTNEKLAAAYAHAKRHVEELAQIDLERL